VVPAPGRGHRGIPTRCSWASSRVDQWVTPRRSGGGSRVAAMMAASSTTLGRPARGSSSSPPMPRAAKRSLMVSGDGCTPPSPHARQRTNDARH
jgi:hypothetical protein